MSKNSALRALRNESASDFLSLQLAELHARVQSKKFNFQTYEMQTRQILEEISAIDLTRLSLDVPIDECKAWLTQLFETRVVLQSKWSEFTSARDPQEVAAPAGVLRQTLQAVRLLEDRLILWRINPQAFDPQKDPRAAPLLQGDAPNLQSCFPDKTVRIRSGDVFLSRAPFFLSSVIARMTKITTVYSHVVLIYIEGSNGQEMTIAEAIENPNAYIVQAHARTGASVLPLKEYANEGYARVGMFRSVVSAELAHAAAKHAHDVVSSYTHEKMRAAGRTKPSPEDHIPYNFRFDLADKSTIFCSEIIGMAYRSIGISLPTFPSDMPTNYVPHLMGIDIPCIFAPSDIEIDPNFRTVAEWRDLRKLNEILLTDAAFDAVARFIDHRGYRAQLRWTDKVLGWTFWQIRQAGLAFQKEFPRNLRALDIMLNFLLQRLGKALLSHLHTYSANYRALNAGQLPTPEGLQLEMDRFCDQDATAFRQGQASFFHRDFRKE